nr:YaaL family protein [Tumebacillus amylolyticus]
MEEEPSEFEKLRQEIDAARKEWAIAQQHIDHVSEPELIDHAIYYLEAAERKYGYLLREAKKRYNTGETPVPEPSR